MADNMFTSGRGGYLQLWDGTRELNIKALAGTAYSMGDNDVIVDGAQGSVRAAASSALTGMYTPRLDIVCSVYPYVTSPAVAGWYDAAFMQYAMGVATADLALRTVPNLREFGVRYVNNDPHEAIILDTMKLAAISFEAAPGAALLCRMTLLGIGTAGSTSLPAHTFGAYVDSGGSPLYWKNVTAATFLPLGGSTLSIAPTTQGISWGISTGAGYGKTVDGLDTPTIVDVLTVLGASLSVDQRAGADTRAFDSRNGTFSWTVGAVTWTMQGNRQGRSYPMNPSGQLVDRTSWQMYWHTTASAPLSATAV